MSRRPTRNPARRWLAGALFSLAGTIETAPQRVPILLRGLGARLRHEGGRLLRCNCTASNAELCGWGEHCECRCHREGGA